jgi:ATP-dependent helicase HrpB
MAATLGKTSASSRLADAPQIENFGANARRVVTEGVFARMILDDAALEGVAGVLFDEYHERSLDADLGLALARRARDCAKTAHSRHVGDARRCAGGETSW